MEARSITFIIVEIFIGLLVITGNTIVCYVVLNSPLRKKVMYMFVTSLALADICVALTSIPFSILSKLGFPHAQPLVCIAMLSFIVVPTQISIFNILAVAVERYLAIRCPIIHHNRLTHNRSIFIIFITWFLSVIIGMLPLFGWNNIAYNNQKDNNLLQNSVTLNLTYSNSTWDKVEFEPLASIPTKVTSDRRNFLLLQQNKTTWQACVFMNVMDFDYMFFNFVACVLPPLVASSILYSIIFSWLLKIKHTLPSTPHASHILDDVSGTARVSAHKISHIKASDKNTESSGEENDNLKKVIPAVSIRDNVHRKRKRCYSAPSGEEHITFTTPEEQILLKPLKLAPNKEKFNLLEKHKRSYQEDLRIISLKSQSGIYGPEKQSQNMENINSKSKESEKQADENKKIDNFQLKPSEFDWRSENVFPKLNHSACSSPVVVRSRCDSITSQSTKKYFDGKNQKKMREFRAAAVLALLVLSFTICWLPIHILNTIHRFDYSNSIYLPPVMFDISIILSHTNSAINFFLYAWRLKLFRKYLDRCVLNHISAIFSCKSCLKG